MLDFVKIRLEGCDTSRLKNLSVLAFTGEYNERTGEVGHKVQAEYHHCKIMVYNTGTTVFAGSLHKMFNSLTDPESNNLFPKGFNGNQFLLPKIDHVLEHLENLFQVPRTKMFLTQVEYGLNLVTSFDPQLYLDGQFLYGSRPFDTKHGGYYRQVEHTEFILKTYNKGLQYDLESKVLRIEVKVRKMRHQDKLIGIKTVADITPMRLERIFDLLSTAVQKTVYLEPDLPTGKMSRVDENRYNRYSNPQYWMRLTAGKRYKPKKHVEELNKSFGHRIKEKVQDLIEKNRVTFHSSYIG